MRTTHRLGQNRAFPPGYTPGFPGISYAWVADEMSTDTPGPMVEDSDTFFR